MQALADLVADIRALCPVLMTDEIRTLARWAADLRAQAPADAATIDAWARRIATTVCETQGEGQP